MNEVEELWERLRETEQMHDRVVATYRDALREMIRMELRRQEEIEALRSAMAVIRQEVKGLRQKLAAEVNAHDETLRELTKARERHS